MNLGSFKALCDSSSNMPAIKSLHADDNTLITEIRDCFTTRESDQAFSDVRAVIADLGLRYLCDQAAYEPYLGVAEAIQQALRHRGRSSASTSNWQRAAQLGSLYAIRNRISLSPQQQWISDVRVSTLSMAIRGLRAKGYTIDLPSQGGVHVPESETTRLSGEIGRLSASLGCTLATSAAKNIASKYSPVTGRFNLGRPGLTVLLNASPQLPLAYLYQLGLRYFHQGPSSPNPREDWADLVELVTLATGLLDLTVVIQELLFARLTDIVGLLQKSVAYDSVFLVTQAKPAHAREYLEWMMAHKLLAELEDISGRTTKQVLSVALMLLDTCEKADSCAFSIVQPQEAALACSLEQGPAVELLRNIFTHFNGANQELTFPPKDTDIDSAFRPLIAVNGKLYMQPPPIAARAIVNAALDWCRRNWSGRQFDDEAIGPMFEQFVREKLEEHGVSVRHGKYKEGQSEGECDAVVETQKAVIFFELKSKMLTRAARDGDGVVALADLAQALVRPQAQALERHAVLKQQGTMSLTADSSRATINLDEREVLKVSVTRGDLGSLHDRQFLGQFLRAGCVATFSAPKSEKQGKLKELHTWFNKFKTAAVRAGESDFRGPFPFQRSWSLSVFQLLLLLERSSNSEGFSRELQRTRRIITNLRDFYAEYEYLLSLEQNRGNGP